MELAVILICSARDSVRPSGAARLSRAFAQGPPPRAQSGRGAPAPPPLPRSLRSRPLGGARGQGRAVAGAGARALPPFGRARSPPPPPFSFGCRAAVARGSFGGFAPRGGRAPASNGVCQCDLNKWEHASPYVTFSHLLKIALTSERSRRYFISTLPPAQGACGTKNEDDLCIMGGYRLFLLACGQNRLLS